MLIIKHLHILNNKPFTYSDFYLYLRNIIEITI